MKPKSKKILVWQIFLAALAIGLFSLSSLLSSGCSAQAPALKTYEQIKAEIEKSGSFVDPKIEIKNKLSPGTSDVVAEGKPSPKSGIVYDRDKVIFYEAIASERDRLHAQLEVIAKKAAIDKAIYEQTITHLNFQLSERKTWWEKNKGTVGICVGIVLGIGLTTGLVYGLTRGSGINQSSSALSTQPMLRW